MSVGEKLSLKHNRNLLRGVVPVASGWDTPPSNLENCTDGNISTATGTGQTVKGGAGDFGYLVFDLGSIKFVDVSLISITSSNTGNTAILIESSDDNNTWRSSYYASTLTITTTAALKPVLKVACMGRYIRIRYNLSAAGTATAIINNVSAVEIPI